MRAVHATGASVARGPHSGWSCGVSVLALTLAGSLALAGAASAADAPQAPPAQQAGKGATQLEEITVTARYKSENLQKTPIAITALNGDQLTARGFDNIVDVYKSAPNVVFQQAGASGGKSAVAYIRGVGQNDFTLAFEPGVGFYLDDVYFGTIMGAMFDLGDVDRVEILRGPQGTLFGKNNEGGAVRIFTAQPKGDNSGYLEAGFGNYDHYRLKGAYDFSIIPDKLAVRLSGGWNKVDGYVTRYDFVCKFPALAGNLPKVATNSKCILGHEGSDDAKNGRINLKWTPTNDLSIALTGDYLDDRGEAAPSKLLHIVPGGGLGDYNNNVLLNPTSGFYTGVPLDSRFLTASPYTNYSTFKDLSTGFALDPVNNVTAWGIGSTINWSGPMGLHVKNILAYRAYRASFAVDFSGAPLINAMYSNPDFVHHQLSEELNVSGVALDNKLDWVVGGYYYDGYSRQGNGPVILTSLEIVPPAPPFFSGFYGLNFYTNDPVVVLNKSAFVHADYHATDKLNLELGVRYSDESKTYTFSRILLPTNPQVPFFPPGQPLFGFENNPSETSATQRWDPKVALQYSWTPRVMTYVQFATGYKGGGINPHPASISEVVPFKEETLSSYEIGAKTQWYDNRVRLNLAAFTSDYKNLQITVVAADAADVVSNAGHVRITGVEGELEAEPLPGLQFNGSFGYLHYHTIDLGSAAGVPGGPCLTCQPAYVPNWKYNIGVQYAIDLMQAGTLTPRLDWTWQSNVYNDPSNNPLLLQPGYGLLDARLTWDSPKGGWQVALVLENALNKTYYVNMFDDLQGFNTVTGQPGWPRTVMGTIRKTF
jgi:iron complex outermembrane receptor protein